MQSECQTGPYCRVRPRVEDAVSRPVCTPARPMSPSARTLVE